MGVLALYSFYPGQQDTLFFITEKRNNESEAGRWSIDYYSKSLHSIL